MDERILLDIEVGGNGQKTLGELKADAKELRKDMQNLVVGTEEYNKKLKELQDVNKLVHRSNQQMKTSADAFGIALKATTTTVSALSSAVGSYAAVIGLGEKDTGKLVEVLAKVQTAMSIAYTVQGVTAAIQALRVAFALLTSTMLANPFIAAAAALAAITAAVYALVGKTEDATKANEDLKKSYDELSDAHLAYLEAVYEDTGTGYEEVLKQRKVIIENINEQLEIEKKNLEEIGEKYGANSKEANEAATKIYKLALDKHKLEAKTQKEADAAAEKERKAAKEREEAAQKERDAAKKAADAAAKAEQDRVNKMLAERKRLQDTTDDMIRKQREKEVKNRADIDEQIIKDNETRAAKELELYNIRYGQVENISNMTIAAMTIESEALNNVVENEEIAIDRRIAAAQRLAKIKESLATKQAALDKKLQEQSVAGIEKSVSTIQGILDENTIAYKAIASAQVIMDTAKGIMGITASMSQGGLAAPALIAAGIAGVVATGALQLATINGAFSGGSSKSMPNTTASVPQQMSETPQPVYLSDLQLANAGQNQRVYILDSDIANSVRRVEVTDSDTTY